MIKCEPYSATHLERIKAREIHQGEVPSAISQHAITILHDEVVLAIVGCFWVSKGVLSIFALISDAVQRCPIAFHKTVLKLLNEYEKNPEVRRMQLEVKSGYQDGILWARSLGFEVEGLMAKYGVDGSDHLLLARVK